ncbi:YceI family protein [Roseibium sp. RKSG952]|uniref:YceI family protein n=1 Tax=Roseibium sp. RKSG952 TaxID=2529384 RepID=UPI0012BCB181|nr:YceI family protein [Roseibium sp. RKSG952]MTH98928.1 polyisoprenoid-binding protein [Roseibium sp. RKSG952]
MHTVKLIAATALLPLVFGSLPATAATWDVDEAESKLGFEVKQGDGTVKGTFPDWSASIDLDPTALETAVITAQVQTTTINTGVAEVDSMLPGADFFDVNTFPVAEFLSQNVRLVGGNNYEADGTLSVRGIVHPAKLTFTLDIDGNKAHAVGEAKVKRLDYDIGKTVNSDTLGNVVTVSFDLKAVQQ